MPEFAKQVKIERVGKDASITIDGDEFPWYIAENGIVVEPGGEMPSVTIKLLAEDVKVSHSLPGTTTPGNPTQ